MSKLARPLPVEYLLLDIPASTPLTPLNTFSSVEGITKFPVENRLIDGHIQDFDSLSKYLRQFTPLQFRESISDFHLLLYIATMEMLPMKVIIRYIFTIMVTKIKIILGLNGSTFRSFEDE